MNKITKEREEYSVFLKHLQEEKEETSNFAKTLLVIVSILCGMVIGFLLLSDTAIVSGENNTSEKKSWFAEFVSNFSLKKNKKDKKQFTIPLFTKRQTILLVGTDAGENPSDPWAGTRTDTIILLNIDAKTKSINAISVPRDSKVFLPHDYGIQKINAAHALGGIQFTKETLEETLGIKINHYIMVNDAAVEKSVDALGGVPIYVEKEMHYHDYSGKLHINLNKGLNILDGRNAVGYLRFRKDGLGDIGRTQRQQWFLRGLLEKLQNPQAIARIPELINIVTSYIKTDLSLYEISQLASLAKNIDMNKIEVATLPGAPNQKGTISYWILDPEKTQEVIDRMIYRDKTPLDNNHIIGGVIYAGKKSEQAEIIKSELEQTGITVSCFYKADITHSQFIAQSSSISNDFFNWLKKKVSYIKNIQFVYDPVKNFCPKSDFTIILAGD